MRANLVLLAWVRLFLHQKAQSRDKISNRTAMKIRRKEHLRKLGLLKFRSRASSRPAYLNFNPRPLSGLLKLRAVYIGMRV